MQREELGDLWVFLAVVEERSFTKAAARLGTSQSSISHTVRRLEQRLNLQLLTRTTLSVAPTEAGLQLIRTLQPAFGQIATQLDNLNQFRERIVGHIRLTATKFVAESILLPAVNRLLSQHPQLQIEISVEQRLLDLAAEGFDAGVRLGEQVAKDMVAVRISPDLRFLVAGSPAYFAEHPQPLTPQQLTEHNCINLRLPTAGGLYTWEFKKAGRELNVRVAGQLVCNEPDLVTKAALAGAGLCFQPEDALADAIKQGKLLAVLEDWCPLQPGYHLYFPSRQQHSAAFRLLIDALKYPPINTV
ncbi:LysR family transcriptional regulator [Shewanella sp. A32]|uniref:LysR family transcriptional regulator n=1 Tax=Shewanella sp. A32 TaxID=3031327 RepID=UPI0023B919E3|nr:LysR family transcriptional regulator [Shewanella sp. A32]MDF0534037.1 LysR family transcriptional regulator [Shewanella sp. A32]